MEFNEKFAEIKIYIFTQRRNIIFKGIQQHCRKCRCRYMY